MDFPRPGDSDEVRNLVVFARRAGGRITCTTNHALFTGAGFISYHRKGGTNGNGLAIDVAGPDMKAIFKKFAEHKSLLHELIHTPMGYSIKDGKTVGPIAAKSHYNHVHISVKQGTFLPVPTVPTPLPDPVITPFPGDHMKRIDNPTRQQGDQGEGWYRIPDTDAMKVVSVVVLGPYPPVDKYWNLPVWGRQQRGADTIITLTEADPRSYQTISVWIAD